ncbi:MAG: hypothetical protein SP1CHLAM54_03110 [Chlamydiia bacterium]|nr:hypothetical protein [Chlamydiia bacterium]MCH9615227.1 hypothetical protein [Chlamydiia bacterium]MCH9628451.1 hypothetical protein [Chlamydiia bacterium]
MVVHFTQRCIFDFNVFAPEGRVCRADWQKGSERSLARKMGVSWGALAALQEMKRAETDPSLRDDFGLLQRVWKIEKDEDGAGSIGRDEKKRLSRLLCVIGAYRPKPQVEPTKLQSCFRRKTRRRTRCREFKTEFATTGSMQAFLQKHGRKYEALPVLSKDVEKVFRRRYCVLQRKYGPRMNLPNAQFTREFNCYYQDLKRGSDSLFEKNIAVVDIGPPSGLGVFAKRTIKRGDIVGLYTGEIVKVGKVSNDGRYAFKALDDGAETRPDFGWLKEYDIDGGKKGSWTTLINASAMPNVTAQVRYTKEGPVYVIVANQEINRGKQLFLNYGPEYWDELGIEPVELKREFKAYPDAKQLL